MNFKTWLIILLILTGIGIGVYFLFLGTKSQEKKIQQLEQEIAFLKKETTPIRYTILSKENGNITVGVKFYDLDGNQIGKPQRFTMKGNTASFEFYVVKFDKGYIAFPVKIYTDLIAPENGTWLYEYYEKDNFPMVFYSKKSSKDFNEGIEALFEKIKSEDNSLHEIFISMVQKQFKADSNRVDGEEAYKIVVHTKGGIEIVKEND